MLHLSIQGPQASGKTTSLRTLESQLADCAVSYEYPLPTVLKRDLLGLDIMTREGFIANQRLFIEAEIDRYNTLQAACVVFDRGPEDTECYTINYPRVIGEDWSTEDAMEAELRSLRACRIDRILYLDAPVARLITQKEGDTRRRRNSFNPESFAIYRAWFAERDNCDFLDVSELNKTELAEGIAHWIQVNRVANKSLQ